MEKDKATHSSILAWRIPWTEEPGELQFMGSRRVRHDWSELAHMYACCSRYQSISFKAEQHSTVWTPSIYDACSGVSRFWLLWIVLLRTCVTRHLCEFLFSALWGLYPGVELLGHMMSLFHFLRNSQTAVQSRWFIFYSLQQSTPVPSLVPSLPTLLLFLNYYFSGY